MSKLLIATCINADDAPLAERLMDWIYHLNGKQSKGHLLLGWALDTHEEMRVKIKISAELAFESVVEINLANQGNPQNKVEQVNSAFRQVSEYVAQHYRWPFLWLEPDCVPLKPDWIGVLATIYDTQPRRYCGSIMAPSENKLFMARVGMYHPAAFHELNQFTADPNIPFEVAAGDHIVPSCTKTRLIQQFSITDDASMGAIRPDAVLLHGDKWGKVIRKLKNELQNKLPLVATNGAHISWHPKAFAISTPQAVPPKIDKRTRAYRALKAQQKVQQMADAITPDKEQRQYRKCQTDPFKLNTLECEIATSQLNAILQQLLLEKSDMVDVRYISILNGDAGGYFLIQAERPTK